MDFSIPNDQLRRLASDPSFSDGYAEDIVEMYRQTLQIIAAVPDESNLSVFHCLRYAKVRGRGSRRTIALTDGASLAVRIENRRPHPEMVVERIVINGRKK